MNRSHKWAFLMVAVVCLGLGLALGWVLGQWSPPKTRGTEVLATVGDTEIDVDQFRSAMLRFGGLKPGQYRTMEQKRLLLDRMIHQSVLVSAALEEGLHQDPDVLNVWHELLADRYMDLYLRPRLEAVEVSEEEVQQHYADNQRKYVRPARRRAALILRSASPDNEYDQWLEEKQAIEEARLAATQLAPGLTHFGNVATQYSQDRGSRYVGGVIGWFVDHPSRSYKWHPKLIEALYDLDDVGDISPVIELPDGFALIRLVDLEPEQERAYGAVSQGVRNKLLHDRQVQEKRAFQAELAGKLRIVVDDELLASVEPLSGEKAEQDEQLPALPSG